MDVIGMLPASMQGAVTFVFYICLGVIALYGLYKKLAPERTAREDDMSRPIEKISEQFAEAIGWLRKISENTEATRVDVGRLMRLSEDRQQQEREERAYKRGRDNQADQVRQSRARVQRHGERDDSSD